MALTIKQQYFDMVRDSIAAYSSPLGQLAGVNLGRISVVEMPAEMRPFALMSSAPGIIFVNPDKDVLSVPTAVVHELGRLVLEALNPDFFLRKAMIADALAEGFAFYFAFDYASRLYPQDVRKFAQAQGRAFAGIAEEAMEANFSLHTMNRTQVHATGYRFLRLSQNPLEAILDDSITEENILNPQSYLAAKL